MTGVYLDFLISNFGDERKVRDQLTICENNIQTDINNNPEKIEELIDYHRMLRDSSRYYLHSNKENYRKAGFSERIKITLSD